MGYSYSDDIMSSLAELRKIWGGSHSSYPPSTSYISISCDLLTISNLLGLELVVN